MPHTKTERLLAIEALLLANRSGLTQAELARRIGVHRSTIHRYLPELTEQFQVYETDDGRLAIDRDGYLARVRLTVHEAAAAYMASRLLYRHSDEANPHVVSSLRKIGGALAGIAPPMAEGIARTAEHLRTHPGRAAPSFIAVLETLTRGWVDGLWVRVRYRRLGAVRETDTLLAPYLLEPVGPGFSTYVLGLRRPPGEIQVLKVERIVSAELTDEPYEVPPDFDGSCVFDDAWSIWRASDGRTVEVVLRFDPAVADRVLESRWHCNESAERQPDGAVIWRAPIGETIEIEPWVRSWGADVEVLEPEVLRRAIAEDCAAAAALYGPRRGGG